MFVLNALILAAWTTCDVLRHRRVGWLVVFGWLCYIGVWVYLVCDLFDQTDRRPWMWSLGVTFSHLYLFFGLLALIVAQVAVRILLDYLKDAK